MIIIGCPTKPDLLVAVLTTEGIAQASELSNVTLAEKCN